MFLTINDPGSVALALIDPPSGLAYNPTTLQMETPFDPSKHLIVPQPIPISPVSTVASAPGTHTVPTSAGLAALKFANVGSALQDRPNLAPVWFSVDANGNPTGVKDCWPNPTPQPFPVYGGFAR